MALLFSNCRTIRCLSINFIKNHTERAFAFYLSKSDVSKQTTDKQQHPTVLNNPADDFHRANHSTRQLISQDVWVVACSSTSCRPSGSRRLLTPRPNNNGGLTGKSRLFNRHLCQLQVRTCVVIGGKIVQVVLGQRIKPFQPGRMLQLPDLVKRTVYRIAALDRTALDKVN